MSLFEKYAEARNKGSVDVPPQGKGSKSYFAPHAKNNAKAKIQVAEKPRDALGDKASPTQKNPKDNLPGGMKPDTSKLGGLKNEEFIKATANMSNADFVSAMIEEDTDGIITIPTNITPYELAARTARLLCLDHRVRRAFTQELKRLDPKGTILSSLSEGVAPPTSKRFKKPGLDTRFDMNKQQQQPAAQPAEQPPAPGQAPDPGMPQGAAAQPPAAQPPAGGAGAELAADFAS